MGIQVRSIRMNAKSCPWHGSHSTAFVEETSQQVKGMNYSFSTGACEAAHEVLWLVLRD